MEIREFHDVFRLLCERSENHLLKCRIERKEEKDANVNNLMSVHVFGGDTHLYRKEPEIISATGWQAGKTMYCTIMNDSLECRQ